MTGPSSFIRPLITFLLLLMTLPLVAMTLMKTIVDDFDDLCDRSSVDHARRRWAGVDHARRRRTGCR